MKRYLLIALLIVLMGSTIGCGESTSAKVAEFTGSDCKSHLYLPPAGSAALFTMEQSEPYQGLQCVSWQHDENNLFAIDLINFHGACGAQYVGDFREGDEGKITLQVNNPGCEVAACGYCVFDWSFEVEDVTPTDLALNVVENSCPGQYEGDELIEFNISEAELSEGAGLSCTYKRVSLFETLSCGTLHQPCNQLSSDRGDNDPNDPLCGEADTQCDNGYTCIQTDDMPQPTCVAECIEDADCPLQPLLTCSNGLCLI